MRWLTKLVDEIVAKKPEGEILIESGGSPSGTYHLGHMRELVICDAILLELRRRDMPVKHIYFVDDLDIFRKVPINVPAEFDQYLGRPLCDVPSPDGAEGKSYADFFLQGLIDSSKALGIDVEFVRSSPKYRSGWYVDAIELALDHVADIKDALEIISNRKLDPNWTPIQVLENGRLKNRKFISIDKQAKTLSYEDGQGETYTACYDKGEVKLDWRIDWPTRWWKLSVDVEPFGREHASAGGSYDTGVEIMKRVFKTAPPIPVGYDSIHMVGDTKKMSASKGTAVSALESASVIPAEVLRYFILRSPLNRPLFFDPIDGTIKLVDEFAALLSNESRTPEEENLLYICRKPMGERLIVSQIPFSHLVESYQSALKDPEATLAVLERSEYLKTVQANSEIIKNELKFIDAWLEKWAPEEVKFTLQGSFDNSQFNEAEKAYFAALADKISSAPADADGEWFHKAIYEFKESTGMQPKELFTSLYRLLIAKDAGPRAGWFLSLLPRDWLISRLRLES